MGKVTEWYFKQNNIKNELENNLPSQEINTSKIEGTASWRISLYKGGEDVVSSKVLFDGLARYEEWKNQYEGYMEIDSPLFLYRNKLGRFCGRAVDAPQTSNPFFCLEQS